MAKRIYLSGEEFVKKLYEGEKDLKNTELASGTNLLLVDGFKELRDRNNRDGLRVEPFNLTGGVYRGLVAPKFILPYVIAYDADFSGAVMPESDFRGGQFGGAKFNNASMGNSIFYDANLNHTEMVGTSLMGAMLNKARVRGSNLDECDFIRADLRYSDFRGSSVEGTKFEGARVDGMLPPNLRKQINPDPDESLIRRIFNVFSR